MKRVGLVSFIHESNTFNPVFTTREMFDDSVVFGEEVVDRWGEAHHEVGGMIEEAACLGVELVPLVAAWVMPAGPLLEEAYEGILGEILTRVSGLSLDGLLLSLHGAMVSSHIRDADGNTAEKIRRLVGSSLPVVLTLDLHANVSERLIENVTATTIYRSYPHLDQRERGREAARIMNQILEGEASPIQSLVKPPLAITILAQETTKEPMAGLYRALVETIQQPGIISASIAPGFAYADVEEMGTSFLVVSDGDQQQAREAAVKLANQAWRQRDRLNLTGTPVDEAVEQVAQAELTPITLLDAGDNVGGGSPGDGTVIFEALAEAGVEDGLVVLFDPAAVQACAAAGVGESVALEVGGKSDQLHGDPVAIEGRVRCLHDGMFVEEEPRHGGSRINQQGLTAVVETRERHTVVLTSLRMAPFSLEQILSLGVKPQQKRVLIAKGAIAPRAAYEPVSASMLEVDSPGITAANPSRFTYRHRVQPMFPFEPDTDWDSSLA